jgi:hypothetical protein
MSNVCRSVILTKDSNTYLVSPVAAHKAVRKVPVSDILCVINRHDVPNVTTVDYLADLDAGWEVAHHVTHRQDDVILLARLKRESSANMSQTVRMKSLSSHGFRKKVAQSCHKPSG